MNQPVNNIMWVAIDDLYSNNYNPNYVADPELELLKISILEDGWTQPIVARKSGEIVDGYHRWLVAKNNVEVLEMTDHKLPVAYLNDDVPFSQQIMSTIRHNRARGQHGVLDMAMIVQKLIDVEGLSKEEVKQRLQMEHEEIERLYDRGSIMDHEEVVEEFNNGWIPKRTKR